MKKIILIIIAILVVAGLSGGGVWLWYNNKIKLEKQKIELEAEQKTEKQKTTAQTPTNPLFSVKKIDFAKQSLENFDKNDPYYNLIIKNVNHRLGKVVDPRGYERIGEDAKESSIISYSIANDGYIFVTYGAWGFSRLAKIDSQSEKLVAEYYYFARSDSSVGGPSKAICYYNGDNNKILFKNEYSRGGPSYVYYYYNWDLNKKSIYGADLQSLDIKNDSELINYCKTDVTNKPTTQ